MGVSQAGTSQVETHTHTHTHTYTHTGTQTHIHRVTHIHTESHAQTHTYMHTDTHTETHIHKHRHAVCWTFILKAESRVHSWKTGSHITLSICATHHHTMTPRTHYQQIYKENNHPQTTHTEV